MDQDNLTASFKLIGDALEKLEVVDNDRQIRLSVSQRAASQGEDWGTRLVFREPEEDSQDGD